MKICACVAEYNPFHNGHLRHIQYIKNELNAEKLIVFMSGDFTQRGEAAVLDKYTRAKHAIIAGADLVIELPTAFCTANAELFASGAVKLISKLNIVDGLCFGVESGTEKDFLSIAAALNDESKEFKKALKTELEKGVSFARAKFNAIKAVNKSEFDESLISSPNNILATEYARAVLKYCPQINLFPLVRSDLHNQTSVIKGVTSAKSIRLALQTNQKRKIKKCVPSFVYRDLNGYPFGFDKPIMTSLIRASEEELSKILDCTEGLENRIKAFLKDATSLDELLNKVITKRYTSTRIQRIVLSAFLGVNKDFILECLDSDLYFKVLAVNSESKDLLTAIKNNGNYPVITRKSDASSLDKTALKCFQLDVTASDLYGAVTGKRQNEFQTLFV